MCLEKGRKKTWHSISLTVTGGRITDDFFSFTTVSAFYLDSSHFYSEIDIVFIRIRFQCYFAKAPAIPVSLTTMLSPPEQQTPGGPVPTPLVRLKPFLTHSPQNKAE